MSQKAPDSMQEYKITIANRDEKAVAGTAQIQHLLDAERNGRANSFFWKAAIGGCLAVIIPPHVLYPVIGLAVARSASRCRTEVNCAELTDN